MMSVKIFKALSDLTRLRCYRIISNAQILAESPGPFPGLSVAEITDILQKPQYAVSRALAELRKAGLVQETRQGQLVLYQKSSGIPGIQDLDQWIMKFCTCEFENHSIIHNSDGTTPPGADPCVYDTERLVWRLDLRKKNLKILTYRPATIGGTGLAGLDSLSNQNSLSSQVSLSSQDSRGHEDTWGKTPDNPEIRESGTPNTTTHRGLDGNLQPIRVLFICIHNSARSQLAEEYLRKHGGSHFFADSAGIRAGKLNPQVIQVLEKQGISIRNKTPKRVQHLYQEGKTYDWVITVCDPEAEKDCPIFPGPVNRLSWPFPDPWKFVGTEEERFVQTRNLAREIENRIQDFIQSIKLNTAV